jgi:hypothetical protein
MEGKREHIKWGRGTQSEKVRNPATIGLFIFPNTA